MPRINVSLPKKIQDREKAIRKARAFKGLSDTLQTLVREEYERRVPPIITHPIKSDGAEIKTVVDKVSASSARRIASPKK